MEYVEAWAINEGIRIPRGRGDGMALKETAHADIAKRGSFRQLVTLACASALKIAKIALAEKMRAKIGCANASAASRRDPPSH